MRRTAHTIEASKSLNATKNGKPTHGRTKGAKDKKPRKYNPKSAANLVAFPPGVSGNPGGLPGTDVSARISRRVFEANEQKIYDAMLTAVLGGKGGNPFTFDILAARGWGKKSTIEHTGEGGGPIAVSVVLKRPTLRDLK